MHKLASTQGRAQLYLTHPELVRQVEELLDYTTETFGEKVSELLDRLDEEKSQVSALTGIAAQLRVLAEGIDAAITKAQDDREALRQDLLRLQGSWQRL